MTDRPDDLDSSDSSRDQTLPMNEDLDRRFQTTESDTTPTTRSAPPTVSARTELPFGLVFFLLAALAMVVFAVQNTQDVALQFLGWTGRFPLAVVIIAVVLVTVVLDEVLGLVMRSRRRQRLADRHELDQLRRKEK